jgi:hypothetical protein
MMKQHASVQSRQFEMHELHISFDKTFVAKSKYLLIAMGIASLYCLGYGVMLFHEFKKMGILDIVMELR